MAEALDHANAASFLPGGPQIQPRVWKLLQDRVESGKLPSSLLLTGRKGIGKWSVACELAEEIVCRRARSGFVSEAEALRQARTFAHPDLLYLFPLPRVEKEALERYLPYLQAKQAQPFVAASDDVTSFITIESIRKFQTRLAMKPALAQSKVGIIYEAERMLPAAMDSLLKTLEEPAASTYLIVITDQPRFLPATILSRLNRVSFPPLSDEFVAAQLREKYSLEEKKVSLLSRFADGSLYTAEILTAGDFFRTREMAWNLFEQAITMPRTEFVVKFSDNAAVTAREKVEELLFHWQNFLRDLAVMKSSPQTSEIDADSEALVNFDLVSNYRQIHPQISDYEQLYRHNDRIEETRLELRRNVNPRFAALSLLLNLKSAESKV
jgi:DNA polymerase-3 subunit delta'